jgi:phosphinothricin acetyltransferase
MGEIRIRDARPDDLPRLTEIYNHYVVNTAITFDIRPFMVEERIPWFEEHNGTGRYRLLVAENGARILGYVGTGPFRNKQAYETSVETSIYCAPESTRRGIGTMLYAALFDALAGADVRRALAGITLPNEASIALHRKFGFREVAHFTENGRKLGRFWDVVWMEKAMQ